MDEELNLAALAEESAKGKRLSDRDLNRLLNRRDMIRTQRNRLGYGMSLGALFLFFGIGGQKTGLLIAAGLLLAVGVYFFLRTGKQIKELYVILRQQFPEGVPEKPPKQNRKKTSWRDSIILFFNRKT